MTAIMLALMFSDATLNASEFTEYRLVENQDQETAPQRRMRQWTPGIDSWKIENKDCPAFFSRELEGFGEFRVGPSCVEEEVPYAL
jgi:hypothetical protein